MTQGLAASVMARAYVLRGDVQYVNFAEKLINGMLLPIHRNGALFVDNDNIWIEEYPAEKPPRHVLNGLVFALLGIYDVYLITRRNAYLSIFKRVCSTLERNIDLYDLLIFSRYDASPMRIANASYHLLNTVLVYVIAKLSGSYKLLKVANRWAIGCVFLSNNYIRRYADIAHKYVSTLIKILKPTT